MKITLDLLKKYEACEEGIQFLQDNNLVGAEALEIINYPNIPLSFLHWGYKFLSVGAEEIAAYKRICKIDAASRYVLSSDSITNSSGIFYSSNVKNSSYVSNSTHVIDSKEIYSAKDIINCDDVWSSFNVKNSRLIGLSKDITFSSNVISSNLIDWSSFCLHSSSLKECGFIYQSSNLNDCFLSGFLTNCNHCICCSNIKDKEYCVFNQKVSPQVFEDLREIFLFKIQDEKPTFIKKEGQWHNIIQYVYSNRYDGIFSGLSDDLYGWIGTLPNYTLELFIQIFFTSNNLQEKEN